MITVTYLGESYTCTTALKGADCIHLLDAKGDMVAAFDGVSDFSGFTISGGSWTTPTTENDCYLAVVKDDGTIGKGGHRCCDISSNTNDISDLINGLRSGQFEVSSASTANDYNPNYGTIKDRFNSILSILQDIEEELTTQNNLAYSSWSSISTDDSRFKTATLFERGVYQFMINGYCFPPVYINKGASYNEITTQVAYVDATEQYFTGVRTVYYQITVTSEGKIKDSGTWWTNYFVNWANIELLSATRKTLYYRRIR